MANYTIPDDTPDGTYTLPTVTVKDAEGNPITEGLDVSFTSTDDTVLQLTPTDAGSGAYHVGNPGVAAANFVVSSGGNPLFSAVANFTVTTGAPASAEATGDIVFSGLTSDAPPAP